MQRDNPETPGAAGAAPALACTLAAAGGALIGLGFDLLAGAPGGVSFDAAYAWAQARGIEPTTDVTSPLMVRLWWLFDQVGWAPGGVHLTLLLPFWSGAALLARHASRRAWLCLLTVLALGLIPGPLIARTHVWTDSALMGLLLLACGLLVTRPRRLHLLALVPITLALCMRVNALPAVLPLLLWLGTRVFPRHSWRVRSGAALGLALTCTLAASALNSGVERKVPLLPSLIVFDLGAISARSGEMLLPPYAYGEGMTTSELADAYQPFSNLHMFVSTRHGIRSPLWGDWTEAELADLRARWLEAMVSHPHDWIAHRLALSRYLFGPKTTEVPREMVVVDGVSRAFALPAVASSEGELHRALMRAVGALHASWLLAPVIWLLPGLIALWRVRRREGSTERRSVVIVLVCSAWLYAIPLILIAPSAELRYLAWSTLASTTALLLALPNGRRHDEAT